MEELTLNLVALHVDVPTTCALAATHRAVMLRHLDIAAYRKMFHLWLLWKRSTRVRRKWQCRKRCNSWTKSRRFDEDAPLFVCA